MSLYRYLVHGYISKFEAVPSLKCIWPPTKGEEEWGTVRSSAFFNSCRTLSGLTWEKQKKKVVSHGKRVGVSKEMSNNLLNASIQILKNAGRQEMLN